MVTEMKFILSFDLPKEFSTPRVRIFRELRRIDAKLVHESFWTSDSLEDLTSVAIMIKRFGGDARILEERFVF